MVLVYPLRGMVLRLAQQHLNRQLNQAKQPSRVGRDHADIGKGLMAAVNEVFRFGDNPFKPAFWQLRFWGGNGLTGLVP